MLLANFKPMFHFYTPWKRQWVKNFCPVIFISIQLSEMHGTRRVKEIIEKNPRKVARVSKYIVLLSKSPRETNWNWIMA